ncbi:MAG: hypothetical protein ACJ8F1_11730 [Polyangia bacterium]
MRPRLRYDLLTAIANPIALAAAWAAWRHGLAPGHLRPAVAFLAASTVVSVAREATIQVRSRRARRRTPESIPWDVRLREPAWSRLSGAFSLLTLCAMTGAVVAVIGFPGVGLGMCLTFAFLCAGAERATASFGPRAVTFTAAGLQVEMRDDRFVIPWSDITHAEPTGGGDSVRLKLLSIARAVASVDPATTEGRARVARALYDGSNVGGTMFVSTWSAGVDAPTFVRALTAAAARREPAAAN